MCKNLKLKNIKNLKSNYFAMYTIIFGATALIAFSWFIFSDKTFIWQKDGWNQHYKALVYYAKYLRTILKNLFFKGSLVIPNWDFSFGEGNDVLGTLHYYVIGDPFTFLSVLVPTKLLSFYFDFIVILRIYLAGFVFSMLCFETGLKNKFAVLGGALSYVFCYWSLLNVARHPYFLNPLVYFPLLILGVEKIIKGKRPYIFIVAVFLSAVSNFYFFYMLALLTVIYAIVRLIYVYKKEVGDIFKTLLKLFSTAILGVLMAAVILFPVIYVFLSDTRLSSGYSTDLLYPLSYYSALPGVLVGNKNPLWLCFGLTAPAVAALFLMFIKRKSNTFLKILTVLGFGMLLFPIFGHVLNGFSYVSNRWSFSLALLGSYIFATMWPSFTQLKKREIWLLSICMVTYFTLCLVFKYSIEINNTISALCIMLVFVICMAIFSAKPPKKANVAQYVALIMVIVGIINNCICRYSAIGINYPTKMISRSKASTSLYKNETYAVLSAAEKNNETEFYRFSGQNLTFNANALSRISSTQYFWSLSNPYPTKFRVLTGNNNDIVYHYQGYDNISGLTSLAAVKYYTKKRTNDLPAPYGFVKTESNSKTYDVYKNTNALPLAYTYNSYMLEEDWLKLSYVDRQEALLQCAILQNGSANLKKEQPTFTNKNIDYTFEIIGDSVTMSGNSFVVTEANATITLKFEGLPESETYFIIEGAGYEGFPEYDLYFGDERVDPLNKYSSDDFEKLSAAQQRKIKQNNRYFEENSNIKVDLESSLGSKNYYCVRNQGSIYYTGREDFVVNLGYYEDANTWVTMTFLETGIYSFDNISINCMPMETLPERIAKLNDNGITNLKVETDSVKCKINSDKSQIVCFAIPYSVGWTAYVDGKEVELQPTNVQYISLEIEAGEHDIQLVYETPLLKVSFIITLIGFLAFAGLIIIYENKRKKSLAVPEREE